MRRCTVSNDIAKSRDKISDGDNNESNETRTYNVSGPSQIGSNNVMNVYHSNGRATDRVSGKLKVIEI